MGASLLVFKNKTDVSGAMSEDDIRVVSCAARWALYGCCQADTDAEFRGFSWT
jgi:hypothetical protein